MKFLNEYEIDRLVERHQTHPVLGPATRFLRAYKDEVNAHSDGWPYWAPPVRAAKQLMTFIEQGPADLRSRDMGALRMALRPIKSFMTRRGAAAGMTLPELEE